MKVTTIRIQFKLYRERIRELEEQVENLERDIESNNQTSREALHNANHRANQLFNEKRNAEDKACYESIKHRELERKIEDERSRRRRWPWTH